MSEVLFGCKDRKRVERIKVDRIQSISASSSHPSFPPTLLLDGRSGSEKAWHSGERPAFPQWVQVEYPEPVVLERITIQAQEDPSHRQTNNLLRAPRRVELWGGKDQTFRSCEKIAAWICEYERSGRWCEKNLPVSSKHYIFYRLIILDNFGDPNYVTIQEMNFFSHE